MRSRDQRKRTAFGFEAMEGRIAPSGIGGHRDGTRHDAAEVRHAHGLDDARAAALKVDDHGVHEPAGARGDDHGKHPAGHK